MRQSAKEKFWPKKAQSAEKSMGKEESIEKLKAEQKKLKRNFEAAQYILLETKRDRERLLLENEALYIDKNQAEKDARIDTLTGLPNLRSYQETIAREIERAKRTGHPLTYMMIDIDDFKKINDREGHKVGDLVIKKLAGIASRALRSSDTVARIGGEEFVIILPDTGIEEAKIVAEKLVRAVDLESKTTISPHFTISGGFAQFNEKNENPHVLKESADRALNEAKMKGKNQILPYDEGRSIEKSELIAQAVRHFQRGMPKGLSKAERKQVAEELLRAIDQEGAE